MRATLIVACTCMTLLAGATPIARANDAEDLARSWEIVKVRWGTLDARVKTPDVGKLWSSKGRFQEKETDTLQIQEVTDLVAKLKKVDFCGRCSVAFELDLPPDRIAEGDRLRMAVTGSLSGVDRSLQARHPDFFIHATATVYGGLWFRPDRMQPLFIHSANSKNRHAYDRGNLGVAITEHDLVQLTRFRSGYEGEVAYLPYADVPATEGRGTADSPQLFMWKYKFHPFATPGVPPLGKLKTMKDHEVVFRYHARVHGDDPPHGLTGSGPTEHVQAVFLELHYKEVSKGHRIHGTVIDNWGHPLREVKVFLTDQGGRDLERVTSTDAKGHYSFDDLPRKLDDRFDPETDQVIVNLELVARRPPDDIYAIHWKGLPEPAGLHLASFPLPQKPEVFERNIRVARQRGVFAEDPRYANVLRDMGLIYRHTHEALRLADLLGVKLDYGLPLEILTFTPRRSYAAWGGTGSNTGVVPKPRIWLGDPTARYWDKNRPDNREWHEFAHHLHADAMGNMMPGRRDVENHAGYYANPSSTDAWVEGLAEFLSMMVGKHVVHEAHPHRYLCQGFQSNLEIDHRAWAPRAGGEEYALAGVLLDLEDGPADYGYPIHEGLELLWWDVEERGGTPVLYGKVRNTGLTDLLGVVVALRFVDAERNEVHRTAVMLDPRDLPGVVTQAFADEPDFEGHFILPLEGIPEYDRVEIALRHVHDDDVGLDDDAIDLTLQQVWETLVQARSSVREHGAGWAFDVKDIYDAFRGRFGGQDKNRNGVDDIDEIFLAHGWFADVNGDRVWQPREPAGRSDHPAAYGGPNMLPRRMSPPVPGSWLVFDGRTPDGASIDVEQFAVAVRYPKERAHHDLAFVMRPDPLKPDRLYLRLPPEDTGATVTVVALASGHLPSAAFTLTAAEYWKALDAAPDDRIGSHTFVLPERPALESFLAWLSRNQALAWAVGGALVLLVLYLRATRRARKRRKAAREGS